MFHRPPLSKRKPRKERRRPRVHPIHLERMAQIPRRTAGAMMRVAVTTNFIRYIYSDSEVSTFHSNHHTQSRLHCLHPPYELSLTSFIPNSERYRAPSSSKATTKVSYS